MAHLLIENLDLRRLLDFAQAAYVEGLGPVERDRVIASMPEVARAYLSEAQGKPISAKVDEEAIRKTWGTGTAAAQGQKALMDAVGIPKRKAPTSK